MGFDLNKVSATGAAAGPQLTLASTENKKETARQPQDSAFVSTTNSLLRSELQLGLLPVNNKTGRLLLLETMAEQRVSRTDDFWAIRNQRLDVGFEPQLQIHLPRQTEFFFRTPIAMRSQTPETPLNADFLADLTVTHRNADLVARLEYGVNGISRRGEETHYVTATPYYRFHLYQNWLMLRLGAKYNHTFGETASDTITFESKLEGTIKPDPWSGWGIQFFNPLALNRDLPAGSKRFDLAGIYAWAGSVLPSSWFGPGFFAEGGIWIGGAIGKAKQPGNDLLAGINFKFKFGSEARWWQ
jgi:hypothetical protein